MKDPKEKFAPDKFPGMLENPGTYRKNSNDFGVTFAVPAEKVELIQPLMQKAGKLFVAYLVQVTDDAQACALMERDDPVSVPDSDAVASVQKDIPETVPVAVLADLLDMTERNVQVLEAKGIVFKDAPGQYRLRESVKSVLKEERLRGDGKNSDFNRERTESMRLKRMERQLNYHTAAGNLVNAAAIRSVIEKAKAAEKQQVLFMPKQLAPRLDGDSAVNEAVLEEGAFAFLKGQTEINITSDISPEPDVDKMPENETEKRTQKKAMTAELLTSPVLARAEEVVLQAFQVMAPPPKLKMSTWAGGRIILTPKVSPEPGPIRLSRIPYAFEPLDCITEPRTREVTLMWAAQGGSPSRCRSPW